MTAAEKPPKEYYDPDDDEEVEADSPGVESSPAVEDATEPQPADSRWVGIYERAMADIPPLPPMGHPMRKAAEGLQHEALRREWKKTLTPVEPDARPLFTPVDDLLKETFPEEEMLIEDTDTPLDALIQVPAKKESFKTFGVLNIHVAARYGGTFLGHKVNVMPGYYVSNEKRRRSIQSRIARITRNYGTAKPQKDLVIVHRSNLRIHPDNEQWKRLVDDVASRKERTLVTLDTVASLAFGGFNEISGESWAYSLDAMRMLTNLPEPATLLVPCHPAAADKGGINTASRGHTSFGGEADGAITFSRPSRQTNDAVVHFIPKDGQYRAVPVYLDIETFLLVAKDLTRLPLTTQSLVDIVAAHQPCDFEAIRSAFGKDASGKWRFGEEAIRKVLRGAIEAGLIATERANQNMPLAYFIPATEEKDD